MNVEYLNEFIREIEKLSKIISNNYLDMAVSTAKDYTQYGEYELALDIALDNLYEGSIFLAQETVNLAHQAYDDKTLTPQKEALLEKITKKE